MRSCFALLVDCECLVLQLLTIPVILHAWLLMCDCYWWFGTDCCVPFLAIACLLRIDQGGLLGCWLGWLVRWLTGLAGPAGLTGLAGPAGLTGLTGLVGGSPGGLGVPAGLGWLLAP